MSLVGAARETNRRKAISVAVAEARKKAEPKKPPPPPPPPKPKHIAPKVVASAPKPAAINAAPKAAPAPRVIAESALTMSNDDAPEGIALGSGPGGGGGPSGPAAAPAKVASAVSSARTRRTREALGEGASAGGDSTGGDAPCNEEPTRPVPVFKTEIEYTAAARAEGIEGKLKLRLTVAADGSVSDVEVLASVEAALDASAVAAAKLWRFKPATACGKPIAGGTYVLQQRFELTD